jgi:glycosyltransferase involved in cell wall biosynthesis
LHYLGSFDQFYYSSSTIGKYFIRLSLSLVDKIGVLSQRTFLDISKFIDKDKIALIPSSVDITKTVERRQKNRDILKVLFIGGSDPYRKGIKEILEVLPSVVRNYNKIQFIFSGSPILKDLIETLDPVIKEKHTEFIGFFDEKDKWDIYHSADILLLPSHNEGLPYVIIEALASGLPIISSTVGGISEVVEDGKNGFIIEPGDKVALKSSILKLASDLELRLAFSQANWKKARDHFSLHTNIEIINNIYATL